MEKKIQKIDLDRIKRHIAEHETPQPQAHIDAEQARAKIEQALSLSESLLLEIAELMTMANRFLDEAVRDKDIEAKLSESRELLREASTIPAAFLSAMIGVLLDSERQVRSPLVVANIIVSEIERLKKGAI